MAHERVKPWGPGFHTSEETVLMDVIPFRKKNKSGIGLTVNYP